MKRMFFIGGVLPQKDDEAISLPPSRLLHPSREGFAMTGQTVDERSHLPGGLFESGLTDYGGLRILDLPPMIVPVFKLELAPC